MILLSHPVHQIYLWFPKITWVGGLDGAEVMGVTPTLNIGHSILHWNVT